MKPFLLILAFTFALNFTACESFSLSPGAQAALARTEAVVGAAALAAADAAANSAATQALNNGGQVDGNTVANAAALAALGAAIRAATAPTPTAIVQSASNYTPTPGTPPPAVQAIAPTITFAIRDSVNAGATLVQAKEAAAKGADSAAQSFAAP